MSRPSFRMLTKRTDKNTPNPTILNERVNHDGTVEEFEINAKTKRKGK